MAQVGWVINLREQPLRNTPEVPDSIYYFDALAERPTARPVFKQALPYKCTFSFSFKNLLGPFINTNVIL